MTPKTEPQVFTIEQREQWPSNVFMLEGEEHEEYYIQSFEELLERLEFWDIKNPGPIYFCKPVYLSELDLDEILEPQFEELPENADSWLDKTAVDALKVALEAFNQAHKDIIFAWKPNYQAVLQLPSREAEAE